MKDRPQTYARAVGLFGALTGAPLAALCQKPADIVRATGRAPSSAYRMLAEAETLGLLAREIDQTYRPGSLARRIGFSALGFGDLADVSGPLLRDLRETLRRTAIIAFLCGRQVRLGLWSMGRGAEFLRPGPRYLLDAPFAPDFDAGPHAGPHSGPHSGPGAGACAPLQLRSEAIGGEAVAARAIALRRRGDWLCLAGVLLPCHDPGASSAVDPALQRLAGLVPFQDIAP